MTYQIKLVVGKILCQNISVFHFGGFLPFWVFKNLSICKAFRNFKPPASSHCLLYARTQLMLRWRWVQKCLQFIISLIMDSCGSLFWPTIGLKVRVVHTCMFGYFGSYKSWWISGWWWWWWVDWFRVWREFGSFGFNSLHYRFMKFSSCFMGKSWNSMAKGWTIIFLYKKILRNKIILDEKSWLIYIKPLSISYLKKLVSKLPIKK